jgi:hypothetical protein
VAIASRITDWTGLHGAKRVNAPAQVRKHCRRDLVPTSEPIP